MSSTTKSTFRKRLLKLKSDISIGKENATLTHCIITPKALSDCDRDVSVSVSVPTAPVSTPGPAAPAPVQVQVQVPAPVPEQSPPPPPQQPPPFQSPAIIVCVMVRSTISKKVLSIWQKQLPSLDSRIVAVVPSFYDYSASQVTRPPDIGSHSPGSSSSSSSSGSGSKNSCRPSSSDGTSRGNSSRSSGWSSGAFRPTSSLVLSEDPTVAYVIMPSDTTIEKFDKWVGYECATTMDSTCTYYYLTPDWVYAFIKFGFSLDRESNLLKNIHPLHPSCPWAKPFPEQTFISVYQCSRDSSNSNRDVAPLDEADREDHDSRSRTKRSLRSLESKDQDSEELDNMIAYNVSPPKKSGKFACMIDSNPELNDSKDNNKNIVPSQRAKNLNTHITDKFKELHKIYEMNGDSWRARTYKQACTMLEQLPFRVTDSEQLVGMRNKGGKGCMGKSVLTKIQEIITTDGLEKLSGLQRQNPDIGSRMEFSKIWGVGPATAKSLVEQGYKSISDLRVAMKVFLNPQKKNEYEDNKTVGNESSNFLTSAPVLPPRCPLTVQQMIGLNRFEDLLERMDRAEVRDIEKIVTAAVKQLDPGASCVVCGSYRRGQPTSGDIDILIYPDDGRENIDILPDLLNALTVSGFLTDHLTVPHTFQGFYPPLPCSQPTQVAAAEVDISKAVDGQLQSPIWLTEDKLNSSGSDTEDDDVNNMNNSVIPLETKSRHASPLTTIGAPVRASSLTSNAVYSYGASQFLETFDSEDNFDVVHKVPRAVGGPHSVNSLPLDLVNDNKRQRQIQLQKHSVVFSKSNSGPTASYMGICQLPYDTQSSGTRREHRHRRIDLKTYPRSYLPFAMLYFTGSAHFNRSMRLYCRQKQMTLNDKGLFACSRDANAKRTFTSAQSVVCHTEHDVFKVLGLVYKEPWNRNTFDNANITTTSTTLPRTVSSSAQPRL